MKKLILKTSIYYLVLISLFFSCSEAPSLVGAWERYYIDMNGTNVRSVAIFSDNFQSISMYNATTGEFIYSNGGTWELNGNVITEEIEFDTKNPARVGEIVSFEIDLTENTLAVANAKWNFRKIDDGSPGALKGAWVMSGRYKDGNFQSRRIDKPRKTMKILSGTRFQWIAFDTEKKEFKGTGGGTYSTIDGKYSEKIEFFSRDSSRVGMELEFDYNIENGDWIHKGKTSKGNPLHEIWSLRKK